MKKLTTREFIERAKSVHGSKYSYEKTLYEKAVSKVTITCPEHGDFEQIPASHLQGLGCKACGIKKCSTSKSFSTAEFIKKSQKVHGAMYGYAKVQYKNMHQPVCITCPEHGDFEQEPNTHIRGGGCPDCGIQTRAATNQSKHRENFVFAAKSVHGAYYNYDKVNYKGATSKVTITCPEHGDFEQTPNSHLSGKGCIECGKLKSIRRRKEPFSTERFVEQAKQVHGDTYNYDKVAYDTSRTPIKITCKDHGDFEQVPLNHLQGCGCPVCGDLSRSKSTTVSQKAFVEASVKAHGSKYDYSKAIYKSANESVDVICKEHGIFTQKARHHIAGHGCPRCANVGPSKMERELYELVKQILPKGTTVKQSVRHIIKPKELDIYIPSKRLAIEFNGDHWHSHDMLNDKKYHQKKTLACQKAGVTLIHVFEHAWRQKRELYLNLIASKLGVYNRKIWARKTEVKPVPVAMVNRLLDKHHFQGRCSGVAVSIGMFFENELIGVMTFGRPRFATDSDWELLRLCYLPGVCVVGGSEKLFKHFTKNHLKTKQSVISYANMDYSLGHVYSRLGFENEQICEPNYVWVKNHTVLPRYRTQKHRLAELLGRSFSENMSETENMTAAGYKKIFTAGNLKYTYKKCSETQQNKN